MYFERFLIWSSGSPPVKWGRTIYAIWREGIMGTIHMKFYRIWTSGSEGDVIKRHFLSRALKPLCSADRNHLCNFDRRHDEEQFCEIISNLDMWLRKKCCLNVFLIWSSCSPFVQRSVTICTILEEDIVRIKYFKILSVDLEAMSFKRFLIWSSGGPPLWWSETIYAILKEGITRNIHVKLYKIWASDSGGHVWQPLCSVNWGQLCNFGRRHHEKLSCKIILIWTSGSGGNAV